MISVQNHRPRLNGNNLWLLLFLLVFVQCKTTKTVTHKPPKSTTDRPIKHPKVDTVEWSQPTKPDVIVIDPNIEEVDEVMPDLNPGMLGVILPIDASAITFTNDQISSRDEAIIQYYAGLKLGLQKLEENGFDLNVFIEDSEGDPSKVEDILKRFQRRGVSYIFGGKGRSEVESIANMAKENQMYYVSGWQVKSSFIGENDNYVQLNPGFQAHALTILKHAIGEFNPEQIILFGSKKEANRVDEINRLYMELTNSDDKLETLIVDHMSELEQLEMTEWSLEDQNGNVVRAPDQKVFIVPITRNYDLIHDFFRFLDFNEMHERSVVYGVTDWNSEKLYTHLNNYDVRLTSFIDPAMGRAYSSFSESFFNLTGTLPDEKAYEGYGHIILMGDFIRKMTDNKSAAGIQLDAPGMKVELVDHNQLESPGTDQKIKSSYLENKFVHLIGFKDFRYYELSH